MKFLKAAIGIGLIGSIILNVLLYRRSEKLRPQLTVNGKTVTKKDYHDWLEMHHGIEIQALMVKYQLIHQAAEKAGVSPTKEEIDEAITNVLELKPNLAPVWKLRPWLKDDMRMDFEMTMALQNISSKDVKSSPDEINSFFKQLNGEWDKPIKLHCKAIECKDDDTAKRVAELMRLAILPNADQSRGKSFLINDLTVISKQIGPMAAVPFGDGAWVIWHPFGRKATEPFVEIISQMQPGEVRTLPIPQKGIVLAIALEYRDEGSAASLADPATMKKVERLWRESRGLPAGEVMRKLWDAAVIDIDPRTNKIVIENLLMPQKANAVGTKDGQPAAGGAPGN